MRRRHIVLSALVSLVGLALLSLAFVSWSEGQATQGEYKIIRGGAWSDSGRRITVFFRNWVRPNQRTPNVGFRCAKTSRP